MFTDTPEIFFINDVAAALGTKHFPGFITIYLDMDIFHYGKFNSPLKLAGSGHTPLAIVSATSSFCPLAGCKE